MSQIPTFSSWQSAVTEASLNMLTSIALFLPNLIGSIILFVVGYILAGWSKSLTIRVVKGLNLSNIFKNSTITKFLKKAELSTKIEVVLGQIIRFLILLVFFVASINLLGLTTVTLILNSILAYLPNVFAATLVLALGLVIGGAVESLVKGSLGAFDLKTSRLLAKISSYTVVIFSFLAAMSQLKIATSFVNTLFTGFVAMLALGLGLSLGLGSKDLVKAILEDWYKDFKKQQ